MKNFTKILTAALILSSILFFGCKKDPVSSTSNSDGVPVGAINGLFSINTNGDQVYFSQGNLQYQASTNTWRFAKHQWDFVGGNDSGNGGSISYVYDCGTVYENGVRCKNELISSTYNGWIDLFGWGTSGHNHGAVCYQPWKTSQLSSNYYAYGNYSYNLYDKTGHADWGYNPIKNGGKDKNIWRTLNLEEWDYIINHRNTASGIRYAKATIIVNEYVSAKEGLILIPDDWNESYYTLVATNTSDNAAFWQNCISRSDWENIFETNGAVFLPVAGKRSGIVFNDSMRAHYWTSSCFIINEAESYAVSLIFGGDCVFLGLFEDGTGCNGNCIGESVRLVCDAK